MTSPADFGHRSMVRSWEDLRCFLAVVKGGSLSAAARQLSLSQPTMGRRIRDLERSLDARLLVQTSEGYALTELGTHIYEIAQKMAEAVLCIERRVCGEEDALSGRVCIATTECIATSWLVAQLPEFKQRYPHIEVEVVTGIKLLNLFRRETDIALRVGIPGSEKLVGQCLGTATFGLYGSERYFLRDGEPTKVSDLCNHTVIESVGDLEDLVQVQLLRRFARGANAPIRCNHLLTQLAVARAGLGLIAMPKYLTLIAPQLRRVLIQEFDVKLEIWLLTHRDLKDAARFRAVREFIIETVRRDHSIFV